MKLQPSLCLLAAVMASGALLLGCEGGINQLTPGPSEESTLLAAYVDPRTPQPGSLDLDKLPILDGDAQDREWSIAQPLFVYVSSDHGVGGPGFYVELRALWSDESRFEGEKNYLYLLVRYGDETENVFPDFWRYATRGQFGLVPSPVPVIQGSTCDSVIMMGRYWTIENGGGLEDQVSLAFEMEPASDDVGTFEEMGCQVACHAAGGRQFGGVPTGKLDFWVWRSARTNAQESTVYPDLSDVDEDDGRPRSNYAQRFDPPTVWPGYAEDMSIDQGGIKNDAAEDRSYLNNPFYTGQLYTRNLSTRFSVDGLPIPSHITELVRVVRQGTGPVMEVEPANGGLPVSFFLWGPTAQTFGICDTLATSRIGVDTSNPRKWSCATVFCPETDPRTGRPGSMPNVEDPDVMPGYLLWIPNGSAADVRAKGDHVTNAQKRFATWVVEFRRPMITGHPDDVDFDPLKEYNFAMAIFDNSSQIHSGSGPLKLRFQRSKFAVQAATVGEEGDR